MVPGESGAKPDPRPDAMNRQRERVSWCLMIDITEKLSDEFSSQKGSGGGRFSLDQPLFELTPEARTWYKSLKVTKRVSVFRKKPPDEREAKFTPAPGNSRLCCADKVLGTSPIPPGFLVDLQGYPMPEPCVANIRCQTPSTGESVTTRSKDSGLCLSQKGFKTRWVIFAP